MSPVYSNAQMDASAWRVSRLIQRLVDTSALLHSESAHGGQWMGCTAERCTADREAVLAASGDDADAQDAIRALLVEHFQ